MSQYIVDSGEHEGFFFFFLNNILHVVNEFQKMSAAEDPDTRARKCHQTTLPVAALAFDLSSKA